MTKSLSKLFVQHLSKPELQSAIKYSTIKYNESLKVEQPKNIGVISYKNASQQFLMDWITLVMSLFYIYADLIG